MAGGRADRFAHLFARKATERSSSYADAGRLCERVTTHIPGLRGRAASVNIRQWGRPGQNRRPSLAQLHVLRLALGLSADDVSELLEAAFLDDIARDLAASAGEPSRDKAA